VDVVNNAILGAKSIHGADNFLTIYQDIVLVMEPTGIYEATPASSLPVTHALWLVELEVDGAVVRLITYFRMGRYLYVLQQHDKLPGFDEHALDSFVREWTQLAKDVGITVEMTERLQSVYVETLR
jgi:hypothetical protein